MNSIIVLCIILSIIGVFFFVYKAGQNTIKDEQENKNLKDALDLKNKQDEIKKNMDIELINKRATLRDLMHKVNHTD